MYITTPATTDRLCAPLLTQGEVSCQNGNRVVLNARRWVPGAETVRERCAPIIAATWSTMRSGTHSATSTRV